MINIDPSYIGIGFITSDFNNWDHNGDFNTIDNNLMYLYGNGFYKTSKIFDNTLKENKSFIKYQWFDNNDYVNIKIDTATNQAIIWNNEIDINKLHIDELNYLFYEITN